MEIIRRLAYARAGLIGNPSDGYNGKTISIIVRNFYAQVTLYQWERLEILPSPNDESVFPSIDALSKDVKLHGYYGGIRLVKAAIKGFVDYCNTHRFKLHDRNFSIRYESNIPRQVGLAGSSAIVVATVRALADFYGVSIPKKVLPSLVLSVERDQLGITAGLQDRVAQVYEGCVYMNFAKEAMSTQEGFECGDYKEIDPKLLPPLYLAYAADCGEPTEIFHNNLRFRYDQGEKKVVQAMLQFAELTESVRKCLLEGKNNELAQLINANFDLRKSICRLPENQVLMIETARKCGASAKFAGSGGAIIGTYENEFMFEKIQSEMKKIGALAVKPIILPETKE